MKVFRAMCQWFHGECGAASPVDTRRAFASAFGADDIAEFNKPHVIPIGVRDDEAFVIIPESTSHSIGHGGLGQHGRLLRALQFQKSSWGSVTRLLHAANQRRASFLLPKSLRDTAPAKQKVGLGPAVLLSLKKHFHVPLS